MKYSGSGRYYYAPSCHHFLWIVLSDGFVLALFLNPVKLSCFLVDPIWFSNFVAPVLVRHYWRSRRISPEHWKASEKLFGISGWVVLGPF